MALTIERSLRQAISAHKEGKLQEAERIYREILQVRPEHPDATHNLGLIAVSVNQIEAAIPLLEAAVNLNPEVEQFWLSYIDALTKAKRFKQVRQASKKAKKRGVEARKIKALSSQSKSGAFAEGPSHAQIDTLQQYYNNGLLDDARQLASNLTETFPNHPFAWKVLGAVLRDVGAINEALLPNKMSTELAPGDAEAHYNLGGVLQALNRLKDAEASYRKAIGLRPRLAQAFNNLGTTLEAQGRLSEAETYYKQAVAIKPDYAEAHNNIAVTMRAADKLQEAKASSLKAIALKPDFAEAFNNLGITLKAMGRLSEAEANLTQAATLKPDFAGAHYNLGNLYQAMGRLDESLACFEKALAFSPHYAEAHNGLGVTFQEQGRLKDAKEHYENAISLMPEYTEAHMHLTAVKTFYTRDQQYLKMLELYHDDALSDERRCHINFGLAKACDDLQMFEEAFSHYVEGNSLRKKLLKYEINMDLKRFAQIKETYSQLKLASQQSAISASKLVPIFILGLPRSGTTLVEQIISASSEVTGAGELPYLTMFGSEIATGSTSITPNILLALRQKYLDKLREVSEGNLKVTDKMPHNFLYIGVLSAAFPEAKIIHVKRDPAAVCWANFRSSFAHRDLGYSTTIEDLKVYHALYEDLMAFWAKDLGDRIYDLQYEQLTSDQEQQTRKLINYLGLSWTEEFLSPHMNARAVATASNVQIRRKVYQGSSEQWKKYRPFLDKAFDGLSP